MMDDLISRRDAINAVSEITTTMSVCTNKDECYGMKRMQKQAITELENMPSAQPDTTNHDSIPAKTGKNDDDRTSGDCISRQAALETIRTMQTYKLFSGDDMILIDKAQAQTELMMLPPVQPERKGRWIKSDMQRWYDVWLCSECGEKTDSAVMSKPRYKYCPMCGAKMKAGE